MTGKYGTRYGASLRKQVKKMEITQHARYTWYCTTVDRKAFANSVPQVPSAEKSQSSATLSESGLAGHAKRRLLEVHGLSRKSKGSDWRQRKILEKFQD